ncbi:DNA polymerase IV [Treponema sp. R6D11]
MDRVILHIDCNSFFASCEEVLNPELKKVPMSVVGDPTKRHGIILASNQLAKKFGVKTAETIWQAKQKCPILVCVSPHHNLYKEYSKKCNEIYYRYTDLVEPFGIDESWLDVTGSLHLFGSGEEIANEIREAVKRELGITVSVGVSFNKVFAKLGSDYKKPDAVTLISRETGKKIVWNLPAEDMLLVGKKTKPVLDRLGIYTIGDIARADKDVLVKHLGQLGETIWLYSNGKDESPVNPDRGKEKSVGNGTTFEKDIDSLDELKPRVMKLCESIGWRCRRKGRMATVLQVAIKDPKFKKIQRQKKLDKPTNLTIDFYNIAIELITENWKEGAPIRSVTVTASSLVDCGEGVQASLFDDEADEKNARLQKTVDELNEKYGYGSVRIGE